MRLPPDQPHKMLDIDALIGFFLELAWHALLGIANIGVFFAYLALGLIAMAILIGSLYGIIILIIKGVKKLYDTVKAHYTRSYDCKYCIALKNRQAPIEDDGPNIIQGESRQSFDEDARTIVGDENGKICVDLIKRSDFEELKPLLTYDGQHSIEEDKETFHKDARMIVGEGSSKSSIDLNEKTESDERNPLLRDDGQRTINKNKESFDKDAQKSFEEEHDMSFVDLNKCYSGAQ